MFAFSFPFSFQLRLVLSFFYAFAALGRNTALLMESNFHAARVARWSESRGKIVLELEISWEETEGRLNVRKLFLMKANSISFACRKDRETFVRGKKCLYKYLSMRLFKYLPAGERKVFLCFCWWWCFPANCGRDKRNENGNIRVLSGQLTQDDGNGVWHNERGWQPRWRNSQGTLLQMLLELQFAGLIYMLLCLNERATTLYAT